MNELKIGGTYEGIRKEYGNTYRVRRTIVEIKEGKVKFKSRILLNWWSPEGTFWTTVGNFFKWIKYGYTEEELTKDPSWLRSIANTK